MPPTTPFGRRTAGVLCHVTSIPDGDVLRWLDFLADASIGLWQVLPLNPPDRSRSPYQSHSLTALDPQLARLQVGPMAGRDSDAFRAFCRESPWLEEFALFELACRRYGPHWPGWPPGLKDRQRLAVPADLAPPEEVASIAYQQYVALETWRRVREAAHERDIRIFGDMPLYPAHDSVDVWANPELFQLRDDGEPRQVAGVPPDYFSSTGQRWGNPLYDWGAMAREGFAWWLRRVRHQLTLCDLVRIDHFRGLQAYWAIPEDAPDARDGVWLPAPGRALLETLRAELGGLPLVAEDLGSIDDAVLALRDDFALPGMRVLQFAFSGDPWNPHLPKHYPENCVAYTATYDNDTTVGWYAALEPAVRAEVDGLLPPGEDPAWRMAEAVFASRAHTAVVPLQDLLSLDGAHRMNTPGREEGNWRWQFDWAWLDGALAARTAALVSGSGRA